MRNSLLIVLLRKVVLGRLIRGLVRSFLEIMFIVITLGIIKGIKGIKKIEIFRSKKRARKKFLRILKLECGAYQSV